MGVNMLSNMRLCSNVPAQSIVQTALGGYQSVEKYVRPGGRVCDQRDFVYRALNEIDGITAVKPKAAFYIFPKIDVKKFNIHDDEQFALDLLHEKKILVTRGGGFNWEQPDHFRVVYLPRMEVLAECMDDLALAEVAQRSGYTRPTVDYGDRLCIKDGRHPVVEQTASDSHFIPNDTELDCSGNRFALITGPNMAGKSTYMRQVALICIMAQIGSFVPAKEAHIGVVDKIFTRVGASDDLAMGKSTFMLEMSEVAYILANATKKSLIIYDEIGRGTSTFDGMSIARAVAEHTVNKIGAKTLFATHYHELTTLEDELDGVVNYNIAAKKKHDDIVFLRKIVRGAADDSYGIEVAKLAGVPSAVVRRAKEILSSLDDGAAQTAPAHRRAEEDEPQMLSFGSMAENEITDKLSKTDINTLTPLEALNLVYELKKMIP